MAGFDRQTFTDLAAIFVLPEVGRSHPTKHVSDQSKIAYSVADALWRERERREQEEQQKQESSEPQPTARPGPEL